MSTAPPAYLDLYWIPLGAGGHCVRLSGRLFEAGSALRHRRSRRGLYHAALIAGLGPERYTIELAPSPDADEAGRGAVAHGPVGAAWLGHWRLFRYEVRCWPGGQIPDLAYAVGRPQRLTEDGELIRTLLGRIRSAPLLTWGRDELGAGEMWNSNSLVAWLLASCGIPLADVAPPDGGRAPGWAAGVAVAGGREAIRRRRRGARGRADRRRSRPGRRPSAARTSHGSGLPRCR